MCTYHISFWLFDICYSFYEHKNFVYLIYVIHFMSIKTSSKLAEMSTMFKILRNNKNKINA